MSHVMCHNVSLACRHLTGVTFTIRVHIENHRVHISSLVIIECGLRWHDIT